MLASFAILCTLLFAVGYGLSALLYNSRGKQLRGSSLEIKILLWTPLFVATILFAKANALVQWAVVLFVLWQLWLDLRGQRVPERVQFRAAFYATLVGIGVVSALGVAHISTNYFLALWLMSVLSDVVAFFAGNYGSHHLPSSLNSRKTWEGAIGQLAGALLGFVLFSGFVGHAPLYFVVTVGVGSLLGDLTNSYIKRQIGIKEWSNRLPGHGGYLDRFSSLSFAALLTYLVLAT